MKCIEIFGNVYLSQVVCFCQDFNGNMNIEVCCPYQESEKFLLIVLSTVAQHYNARTPEATAENLKF